MSKNNALAEMGEEKSQVERCYDKLLREQSEMREVI